MVSNVTFKYSLHISLQDSPSSCCGVGNCTTPTALGLYNTLHHRRDVHYSPVAINNCLYGHNKRFQCSGIEGENSDNSDYRPDIPLLEHNYRTLVLPSSNLTLSDTDTSIISSERDRESEV